MKRTAKSLVAVAIVALEVTSVGLTVTHASAQETTQQKLRRQQRVIDEQQQQIRDYQRRLAAGQQQSPQEESGFLLGCPRGYTYSYFGGGCLPNLPAQVIVTPQR